jgi:hypothetical protein
MRKAISALLILSFLTMSALTTVSPTLAAPGKDNCNPSLLDIDFSKALSLEFGKIDLAPCDVTSNREKGFGYGEMSIAHGLSSISGTPLSRVMQMRTEQKMGWGKIAKQLGVKVSDAVHRSASVLERVGLSGEAARIRVNIDLPDNDDSDDKNDKNNKNDNKPDKNKTNVPHKKQGNK